MSDSAASQPAGGICGGGRGVPHCGAGSEGGVRGGTRRRGRERRGRERRGRGRGEKVEGRREVGDTCICIYMYMYSRYIDLEVQESSQLP